HGGDTLHLKVRRGGDVRDFDVRSGVRPTEASLDGSRGFEDNQDESGAAAAGRVLGMQLQPNPNGGLTIQGLAPSADAADKGLRPGDVILRAGSREAAAPSDVAAAVAEAKRLGRKDVLLLVSHNGQKIFVPVAVEEAKG